MTIQKISVSLPKPLHDFIEQFQQSHHLKSRSEVVAEAIRALQRPELSQSYRSANAEIDDDFDVMSGDGLDDEAW